MKLDAILNDPQTHHNQRVSSLLHLIKNQYKFTALANGLHV